MARNPVIVFRCDASPKIGAGHVTRCRALALALHEQGVDAVFALAFGTVEGFPSVRLPAAPDRLGQVDLEETAAAAREAGAVWVVVDHYGADDSYLSMLRRLGLHVGVIDDRAERDLTAAEWLLNQNIRARELRHRVAPGCVLALGLEYALVRPEFGKARAHAHGRAAAPDDADVLVTLGGGDVEAVSAAVVEGFGDVERPLRLHVVGAAGALRSRHALDLPGAVRDMPARMLAANVAVTAAGSTCWELMCLGVPLVVLPLDEGQRRNADGIEEARAGVAVTAPAAAAAAAAALLDDPSRRQAMSNAGRALVDGRGAERAAATLRSLMVEAAHAGG